MVTEKNFKVLEVLSFYLFSKDNSANFVCEREVQ